MVRPQYTLTGILGVVAMLMVACRQPAAAPVTPVTPDPDIAAQMNEGLRVLREVNELSAREAAQWYAQSPTPRYAPTIYTRNTGNVLADHGHASNANIYVNASIPRTKALEQFLRVSEHLEPRWEVIQRHYPFVGWQYIVDARTGGERSYPWHNQAQLFGNQLDFHSFDFYYALTPAQNPARRSQWTKPTNDLAGLGWICTISSPIYTQANFRGVHVMDLPVKRLVAQWITPKLSSPQQSFLLFDPRYQVLIAETEPHYFLVQDQARQTFLAIVKEVKAGLLQGQLTLPAPAQAHRLAQWPVRLRWDPIPETGWQFIVLEPP